MAETFTDKLKLSKRDTGDLNWGTGENANKDLIDKHLQLSVLRPPRTLLASLGSGAVGVNLLGNTTYFYKVTAFNAAGETTENQIPSIIEAQITEPSTPVPAILQWETVKGASGYRIYKSAATGQEKFLAEVTGESTLTYTDTGNTATNNTISVPSQNTARASVSKIIAGTNVTVSPPDGTGDVTINAQAGAAGVTSLRKEGEASGLSGDVKLAGGTNVLLNQDVTQNKIVISAEGGGYATVVVAAPSGVAATDQTNIQNALNAIGAAGGMVLLREGAYSLSGQLTMKPGTKLVGQGMNSTVVRLPTTSDVIVSSITPAEGFEIAQIGFDLSQVPAGGTYRFLGTNLFKISRVNISKCRFFGQVNAATFAVDSTQNGATNWSITECVFEAGAASVFRFGDGLYVFNSVVANCLFRREGDNGAALVEFRWAASVFGSNTLNLNTSTGVGLALKVISIGCNIVGNHLRTVFGSETALQVGQSAVSESNLVASNRVEGPGLSSIMSNNNRLLANLFATAPSITGSGTIISQEKNEKDQPNGYAGLDSAGLILDSKIPAAITRDSEIPTLAVSGLRKLGEASPLVGDVKLEAGSNITLTQDAVNKKITIAGSGGGGWVKVDEQYLTHLATSFNATNIDVDNDRAWKIMLRFGVPGSPAGVARLILNNSTDFTQYRRSGYVQENDVHNIRTMLNDPEVFPYTGYAYGAVEILLMNTKPSTVSAQPRGMSSFAMFDGVGPSWKIGKYVYACNLFLNGVIPMQLQFTSGLAGGSHLLLTSATPPKIAPLSTEGYWNSGVLSTIIEGVR